MGDTPEESCVRSTVYPEIKSLNLFLHKPRLVRRGLFLSSALPALLFFGAKFPRAFFIFMFVPIFL